MFCAPLPPADESVPKGKVYISMKVPDICLQYEHMYVLDVPKVSQTASSLI